MNVRSGATAKQAAGLLAVGATAKQLPIRLA